MSGTRIDTPQGTFKINQGVGDLKQGIKQGDLSRVSIYGDDKGCHTGNDSPTVGRGGIPFGKK